MKPDGLREHSRLEAMRRIRAAAVELLADRGFNDITTREVAARANIGEATLFRHVESKQALLMLVYGDLMDTLLDKVEQADRKLAKRAEKAGTVSGQTFCDRVIAAAGARVAFYAKNPENAVLYIRQGFDPRNPDLERRLAQSDRLDTLLTSIIREGQDRGYLMAGFDPAIIAWNCNAILVNELDRTTVRGYPATSINARLKPRLSAQLQPLILR